MASFKTGMALTLGVLLVGSLPAQNETAPAPAGRGKGRPWMGKEGPRGNRGERRQKFRERADTDHDGKISLGEREAVRAKVDARAQERGVTEELESVRAARQKLKAARQSGDQAAIQNAEAELQNAQKSMKEAGGLGLGQGGKLRQKVKDRFDTNGDGKLDPEERKAVEAARAERRKRAEAKGYLPQLEAQQAAHKALWAARKKGDKAAIEAAKAQLKTAHEALVAARRAAGEEVKEGDESPFLNAPEE